MPEPCRRSADALAVDDLTVSWIAPPTHRLTVCASSAAARTLDDWQFSLDEGPCLDAVRRNVPSGAEVADPDATPWPLLAAKALDLGYAAIAGVPIALGAASFAAINLQSRSGPIAMVTTELATALAAALAHPLAEALSGTLTYDRVVGSDLLSQATGMVSVQMGVTVAEALNVLRARAWSEDRLLNAIAGDVVDRRLRFALPGDDAGEAEE
ncbi:MAG: hypothetical protein S0880_05540 [Actinomycetota bacterium]|nr:hypothetical protein [Actinomycetota bacterium]